MVTGTPYLEAHELYCISLSGLEGKINDLETRLLCCFLELPVYSKLIYRESSCIARSILFLDLSLLHVSFLAVKVRLKANFPSTPIVGIIDGSWDLQIIRLHSNLRHRITSEAALMTRISAFCTNISILSLGNPPG